MTLRISTRLPRAIAAIVLAGGGLGLATVALSSPVHADPAYSTCGSGTTCSFNVVAGVGSDTIQDVMNALGGANPYPTSANQVAGAPVLASKGYAPLIAQSISGTGVLSTLTIANTEIASFDAIPTGGVSSPPAGSGYCITTKPDTQAFDRPNGSSNGIAALFASQSAATPWEAGVTANSSGVTCTAATVNIQGLVDFARSSRGIKTAGSGTMTWIPWARDAVGVAVYGPVGDRACLSSLNLSQIRAAYNTAAAQGTSPCGGHPLQACITQPGSGTTSFFTSTVLGNPANLVAATTGCGGGAADTTIEENGGNSFYTTYASGFAAANVDTIVDFSAGSWISQFNATAVDRSATARTNGVDMAAITDDVLVPSVALGKPYVTGGACPAGTECPNATFYANVHVGRDTYVVVLSAKIAHTGGQRSVALKGLFSDASFTSVNVSTTNASTTVTDTSGGFNALTGEDVGRTVTGTAGNECGAGSPLFPAGTTITSITNATTYVTSNPANCTLAGQSVKYGAKPGAICGASAQAIRGQFGFDAVAACGNTDITGDN
jgi:hypothetical protein